MVSRRHFLAATAAGGAASAILPRLVWAEDKSLEQVATKGINFLTVKGQADDGSYTKANGPGITGIPGKWPWKNCSFAAESAATRRAPKVSRGLYHRALPPDVRKVYDPPGSPPKNGAPAPNLGHSPDRTKRNIYGGA